MGSVPGGQRWNGKSAVNRRSGDEQSTMGLYLRDLRRVPPFTPEEEQACARLAAQGDETARQRLVQANLRFVILVAKQYRSHGIPLEDLVNEGNIGLLKAAARFDPERGIRFISYAVWWIRQAILNAVRENSGLIRVPRGAARGNNALIQDAGWTLSLDSTAGEGEGGDPLGARLEDRSAPGPEEAMVGVAFREQLGSLLDGLPGPRREHSPVPLRARGPQRQLPSWRRAGSTG